MLITFISGVRAAPSCINNINPDVWNVICDRWKMSAAGKLGFFLIRLVDMLTQLRANFPSRTKARKAWPEGAKNSVILS